MSFYDSQNTDQWGSAFGSSSPAYSSQPVSQPPAAPAYQSSPFGSSPSSQPNYESPASPAFQSAPETQPGAVPVIDEATLPSAPELTESQKQLLGKTILTLVNT